MKFGLFIGRFNPVHLGHINTINKMLSENDHIIIAIGSHQSAFSPNKILTSEEAEELIRLSFNDTSKFTFIYLHDYLYNDLMWATNVRSLVYQVVRKLCSAPKLYNVNLYGYNKDFTSKYLNWFPNYTLIESEPYYINEEIVHIKSINEKYMIPKELVHATNIRKIIFENIIDSKINNMLEYYLSRFIPVKTTINLLSIIHNNIDRFIELMLENNSYQKYKDAWKDAPYPPVFVTGDAVVFCNGHVLVINRKFNPGKSLMALPGGFINQNETVKDCILRELKEETKINVPPNKLSNSIRAVEVFDTPNRSLRGRTITHAGVIILKDEQSLPRIVASDDALNASWLPLEILDSKRAMFFEDHYHIIKNLLKYYQDV